MLMWRGSHREGPMMVGTTHWVVVHYYHQSVLLVHSDVWTGVCLGCVQAGPVTVLSGMIHMVCYSKAWSVSR